MVICAKMAEQIEMLFGFVGSDGPKESCLIGSTCAKGHCHGNQFLAFDGL